MVLGIWQLGVYILDLGTGIPLHLSLRWCWLVYFDCCCFACTMKFAAVYELNCRRNWSSNQGSRRSRTGGCSKDLFLAYLFIPNLDSHCRWCEMMEQESKVFDSSRIDMNIESKWNLLRLVWEIAGWCAWFYFYWQVWLRQSAANLSELASEVHQQSMEQAKSVIWPLFLKWTESIGFMQIGTRLC